MQNEATVPKSAGVAERARQQGQCVAARLWGQTGSHAQVLVPVHHSSFFPDYKSPFIQRIHGTPAVGVAWRGCQDTRRRDHNEQNNLTSSWSETLENIEKNEQENKHICYPSTQRHSQFRCQ